MHRERIYKKIGDFNIGIKSKSQNETVDVRIYQKELSSALCCYRGTFISIYIPSVLARSFIDMECPSQMLSKLEKDSQQKKLNF